MQRSHKFVLVIILGSLLLTAYLLFLRDTEQDTKDIAGNSSAIDQQSSSTPRATAEPDLILQNFGLASLSDVVYTIQATREYQSAGRKGFYLFGDSLGTGDPRRNPNFEFASLKADTKVVSAIDGVIVDIRTQADSNDVEIFVKPTEQSAWTIGYDHLVNAKVTKGDKVTAGQLLGNPSVQGNGLYRFEFQVNDDRSGITKHVCPSVLLAASVSDTWLGELAAMQSKWEQETGIDTLYDPAQQSPVGCLSTSLTVGEAEGR